MIAAAAVAILAPPIDLGRSLRFLQVVKPAMLLADIKAKAGKGVTFAKPEWIPPVDGSLPGFVVRISGPIQGSVSFMNKAQRQMLLRGAPGAKWEDGLVVYGMLLTVEKTSRHSKTASRALIDTIAKTLGKPAANSTYETEWANDFGGWSTHFKVGGRSVAFYQCNFGEVESRLEVLFQQPLY